MIIAKIVGKWNGYVSVTREEEMMSDKVMHWSDLAELTHAKQVKGFGFCTCEEHEQFPYDDCPREGGEDGN